MPFSATQRAVVGRDIISIDTLQNTLPRTIVRVPGALHTYPVWAPAGTP